MGSPETPVVPPVEAGTSLARTGAEADLLRKRLERPARAGRYMLLLLGAIVLGAGIAVYLTNGSVLGLGFSAFGVVLLVLGLLQHLLLRRELAHWPRDALLFEDGLELVLANGEVRGLMWSEPDFQIALVSRPSPAPVEREFLLIWLPDGKVPSVELSEDGFESLLREAAAHRLVVNEHRKGRGERPARWIEVSAGFAPSAPMAEPAPESAS